ncbi:MAG: N-acetylglucosamine-6-phosphate deacetylase, partial [Opitutae bacterium]|nr:N-acetylglucosamine-6-phosphate deacetylase [Opitutae bacterium]
MSASSIIHGCRAVLPDQVAESVSILVEEGKIAAIFPDGSRSLPSGLRRIDAGGGLVGPGFIDPHCHGADDRFFFADPA